MMERRGKLALPCGAVRYKLFMPDFDVRVDACTAAGVWEDDSNIVDLRIYWADTIGGMIKVHVREL